jgi:hypothetical protein
MQSGSFYTVKAMLLQHKKVLVNAQCIMHNAQLLRTTRIFCFVQHNCALCILHYELKIAF